MNRFFKIAALAFAGASLMVSCQEEPTLPLTDVGPEMTVLNCTEATYMGADVKFTVDIKDTDFALSTLKAWLYYDDTKVADLTVRTKEYGTYEASVKAPLYKEIADGTASLVLAAQNVGMGLTYDTLYVSLKRPDFASLTLKAEDGKEYVMPRKGEEGYEYELTALFPEKVKGVLVTPAINDEGEVVTIGWDGSALSAATDATIPYGTGLAGTYTIKADLYNLTASPMGTGDVAAVAEFKQGQVMDFNGMVDLNNWTLDYDFFVVNNAFTEVKFRAVDGLYRFAYDTQAKWVKVEPMANDSDVLTLAADGTGAPWVIGAGIGKPVIGPSWDTNDGAYPMACISDKVYQFTLTVPGQLGEGNFKFFHQKGWGGEFKTENYAKIDLAPAFEMDPESGNIYAKETRSGKSYKITLDLTDGVNAAKISYEEVVVPVNMLDISVNGVAALKLSNEAYKVPAVKVDQNSILSFSGISNPLDWYVDPDHFELTAEGLKFKAVSGYYSFELNLAGQFVTVRRVKEDGKPATYADEGAITLMGWGVAHPVMTNQLGWEGGQMATLAEIEDGVYQFTGKAVEETDGTTLGGCWRYDYVSFKFFGQAGWGAEWKTVTLTDEAKKYLQAPGNVELASGVNLELGATYVMTVTECTALDADNKFNCTVDFKKM